MRVFVVVGIVYAAAEKEWEASPSPRFAASALALTKGKSAADSGVTVSTFATGFGSSGNGVMTPDGSMFYYDSGASNMMVFPPAASAPATASICKTAPTIDVNDVDGIIASNGNDIYWVKEIGDDLTNPPAITKLTITPVISSGSGKTAVYTTPDCSATSSDIVLTGGAGTNSQYIIALHYASGFVPQAVASGKGKGKGAGTDVFLVSDWQNNGMIQVYSTSGAKLNAGTSTGDIGTDTSGFISGAVTCTTVQFNEVWSIVSSGSNAYVASMDGNGAVIYKIVYGSSGCTSVTMIAGSITNDIGHAAGSPGVININGGTGSPHFTLLMIGDFMYVKERRGISILSPTSTGYSLSGYIAGDDTTNTGSPNDGYGTYAKFGDPHYLVAPSGGKDGGVLYVLDAGNNDIRKLTWTGVAKTKVKTGKKI